MNEYDVRVTRQVLEQMKEIVHYISNDLMAPDAAEYERGCRLWRRRFIPRQKMSKEQKWKRRSLPA